MSETILTDEQIDEISNTIDESVSESITATTMAKAEEEKQKAIENGELKLESGIVAIDKETGRAYTNDEYQKELAKIEEEIDKEDDELQSWEEMLADDSIKEIDIDLDDVSVSKDLIKTELSILFPKLTLYDEDYIQVMDSVQKYKNKESFPYFNSFPKLIRNEIKRMTGVPDVVYTEQSRMVLNAFAKNILDTMVESLYMDAVTDKYQEGIREVTLEGVKNVKKDEYWTYVRRFFNHTILDKIKEYEEKDEIAKAERCRGIYYAFKESYNFSIMKDLYKNTGKLRIKKIMLEKFDRTCRDFNSQYENHTRSIINVQQLVSALDKNADKKYDLDVIKEFICIFIKYTQYKNMKPDSIVDHTFMYYFIFNIVTIGTCNPDVEEDVQFKDQLINNINEFLQLIVDKRNLKEG